MGDGDKGSGRGGSGLAWCADVTLAADGQSDVGVRPLGSTLTHRRGSRCAVGRREDAHAMVIREGLAGRGTRRGQPEKP